MRSIYSTISESGPEGARVWLGLDTAATTAYIPLDHRSTPLSPVMFTGTYMNFTRESAFWAFNYVAKWMQLNYKGMMIEDVAPRQEAWLATAERELFCLESASVEEVSQWQIPDAWRLSDEAMVFHTSRHRLELRRG